MSIYFSKYLPVEGEIKEGDYYTWKGIATKGQWVITKYTGANPFPIEIDENHKKVKLFLCSRDIQVGDVYWEEGEQYQHHEVNLLSPTSFKVIGEISSEATWVKDGDEFEENEIQFILLYEQHYEDDTIISVSEDEYLKLSIGDKYGLSQFITLYEKRIEIKGPCDHFH